MDKVKGKKKKRQTRVISSFFYCNYESNDPRDFERHAILLKNITRDQCAVQIPLQLLCGLLTLKYRCV